MSIQDVNHLTISGHVTQPPRLDDDGGAIASCAFVLTHTPRARHDTSGGCEQHYRVIAHGDVAEAFAARHEPGQVVIVLGRLELEIHETLLGPLPAISITAHRIIPTDNPRTPASTASTAADPQQVLAHSAIGSARRPQRSRP
jgi:hypothetical protein